jgi:hypothetical protein
VHVLLQKLQVSNRTQAALIWLGTDARVWRRGPQQSLK